MKLLTVAVPAYNAAQFLPRCLDTVTDENLEVLVINDGSRDNTEEVALQYQERYPEVIRVITKENGGWGSGINRAIREATGEYFINLDADDWFREEGLRILLENLRNHKVDLLLAPGFEHSMKTGKEWPLQFPEGCVYEQEISFDALVQPLNFYFTVHSLVFRTAILQENRIAIDEKFYTDTELIAYPLPYVGTAYVQKEPLYIYRVDNEGQSISPASMAKHADDMEIVAWNMAEWFAGQEGPRKDYYKRIMLAAAYGLITCPMGLPPREQNSWIPRLRRFRAEVLDASESLRDYSQYGLFARIVLALNFNRYAAVAALRNRSLNNRGLAAKVWSVFR